jgi:hypothetical protein
VLLRLPEFIELAPRSRQAFSASARPQVARWLVVRQRQTGLDRPAGKRKPAQAASYAGCAGAYALMSCVVYTTTYVVDVLRGQPIKLIQVVSTSELPYFDGMTLVFSKSFPLVTAGPQKQKYKVGHTYFTFLPCKKGPFF